MPGRLPSEPGWAGEHQFSGSHFELCLDPEAHQHCGLNTFQIQLCLSSYYFWARMPKICSSLAMLPTNFLIPNSPDACADELESSGVSRVTTWSSRLSPSSARTDASSLRHSQTKLPTVFMDVCQAVGQPELPNHQARTLSFWDGCEASALRSQTLGTRQVLLIMVMLTRTTTCSSRRTHSFKNTTCLQQVWKNLKLLVNRKPQSVATPSPYVLLPTKYRLSYAPSPRTCLKTSLWESRSTNPLVHTINMLFALLDRA